MPNINLTRIKKKIIDADLTYTECISLVLVNISHTTEQDCERIITVKSCTLNTKLMSYIRHKL